MTCPKSWRHTFATLLQDAGVDPLIRQIVMGHKPTYGSNSELGMTAVYTHSRAETIHREITRAVGSPRIPSGRTSFLNCAGEQLKA